MKFLHFQISPILCEILFLLLAYSGGQYTTFAPNVTSAECECSCEPIRNFNVTKTADQISREVALLVSMLKVDKAEVSATTRRKTSAKDYRPSAQSIGYVGIICLIASIGGIMALDLNLIYKDLKIAKGRLRELANSSNQSIIRQIVTISADVPDGDVDNNKPLNTDSIKVEHNE